jgi:hypothetical protein
MKRIFYSKVGLVRVHFADIMSLAVLINTLSILPEDAGIQKRSRAMAPK